MAQLWIHKFCSLLQDFTVSQAHTVISPICDLVCRKTLIHTIIDSSKLRIEHASEAILQKHHCRSAHRAEVPNPCLVDVSCIKQHWSILSTLGHSSAGEHAIVAGRGECQSAFEAAAAQQQLSYQGLQLPARPLSFHEWQIHQNTYGTQVLQNSFRKVHSYGRLQMLGCGSFFSKIQHLPNKS